MVVEKSLLVGYSAQQMFALVDAVEALSAVPAVVQRRGGTPSRRKPHACTLRVNYHGVKQGFTTENTKEAPRKMTVRLVEGPFKVLDGEWRFTPLAEHACRIDFRLRYEFSSKLLEKLVGPVFSYIANTMVEAFVKRADKLYGG